MMDVVALGGNAIVPVGKPGTIASQMAITRNAMEHVADLIDAGRRVVLTHGNGPIVGNIVIRNEAAAPDVPPMPLDVCVADSQGGIGYMIQQSLRNVMRMRGPHKEVATVITQVRVTEKDPAFDNPTKPIGPYYSEQLAETLMKERNWAMVEDSGRGYRRVVASPYPLEIVERRVIATMVENDIVVITVGGGGIPVVRIDGAFEGREAVIDKDRASALLAIELAAERLIIVTDADAVYEGYGSDNATPLPSLTTSVVKRLHEQGEFAPGSMGPKIEAAVEFVEATGGSAIICNADNMDEAAAGRAGTTITKG